MTPLQAVEKLRKSEDSVANKMASATAFSPNNENDEAIENKIKQQVQTACPQSAVPESYKEASEHMGAPIKPKTKMVKSPNFGEYEMPLGPAQINWLENVPKNEEGKHDIAAVHLFRSYKHTPHQPLSLFLKYMVHRIEHQSEYDNPVSAPKLDEAFIGLHKVPGKADEVTPQDLNTFLYHHSDLIPELLNMQRRIHGAIHKYSPWQIEKDPQGRPAVNLTRGLNVQHSERGPDHALASYSDNPDTGFGRYFHHQIVPMKNVWYSFDAGPEEASSNEYGAEDEYLVSPHENQVYGEHPALIGESGRKGKTSEILPTDSHVIDRPLEMDVWSYYTHLGHNADKLPKDKLDDLVENIDKFSLIDTIKIFKSPYLTSDQAVLVNRAIKRHGWENITPVMANWSLKNKPASESIKMLDTIANESTERENTWTEFNIQDLFDMLDSVRSQSELGNVNASLVAHWVKENFKGLFDKASSTYQYARGAKGNVEGRQADTALNVMNELRKMSAKTYPIEQFTPENLIKKSEKSLITPVSVMRKMCGNEEKLLKSIDADVQGRLKMVKLDRTKEVTGLAGYNQSGDTVYIDKRVPTLDGHDLARFLLVHEVCEKALMARLGYNYRDAHNLALAAERKEVEQAGLSWDKYDALMQHLIRTIGEAGQAHDVPKDLETPWKQTGKERVKGYRHELKKSANDARAVSICVKAGKYLLMGQRPDGKWNLPGGKVEPGETILTAALRELKEEIGIVPSAQDMKHMASDRVSGRTGGMVEVSAFLVEHDYEFTIPHNPDPDREIFHWVDVSKDLPQDIKDNLRNINDVGLAALKLVGEFKDHWD